MDRQESRVDSMDILSRSNSRQNRGLTLGTSGFDVKVYVDDMLHPDIHANTGIAQTAGTDDQGNPDYSVQFFVSTKDYENEGQTPSHKIRIEVTGLISVNHVATFTLPDTVTPGETTFQDDPLEGSN